jgi:hydrogenase expression/formation protein HypC
MCLAVPGKILAKVMVGGSALGDVEFGGVTRQVNLDFVPEARVGDYVIVHVGFAISRVDAASAARSYELLLQMDVLREKQQTK